MNFEQLKEKSVEIMLKEIKKEAIYMVEAIERDYEPSQIMEAVVYAMDNKEVIESFSKKPKTLIELYDLYVIQGHIFKPLAPLTGISLDKEKVDFNELKSMILEADESNIIEVFETTKGLPVLPGDQIERRMNRIMLESANENIEKIKGGK